VRDAVERGDVVSAADHYAKVGFYEHHMPYENYPDMTAAVDKGVFATGAAHFDRLGFRAGRFSHPKGSLERRPRALPLDQAGA
jgi:hypothetical protein